MQMETKTLSNLVHEYKNAPREFQATSYWHSYENAIFDTIRSIDPRQLRSGKYPILGTFGFHDEIYTYHPNLPLWKKAVLKFFHRYVIRNRGILPYHLRASDIREMAYRHCELTALINNAKPIREIEVSDFGAPQDIFEVNGRKYTMPFLNYYLRYCFAHKHVRFKGNEIVVELGSGSGYQTEVLKKVYPGMTIICLDLPAQIFLCQEYLTESLGKENVVGTEMTLKWKDLQGLKKGHVHCLGNWQIPLLRNLKYDLFWNAASFGEMEPDVVENYLNYVKGNCRWIYLLQARHGKETSGKVQVKKPIVFADYGRLLAGYVLREEHDAWHAHKRLSDSGGYFEGIWMKE
jgi:putative sugar O-methyltransferase